MFASAAQGLPNDVTKGHVQTDKGDTGGALKGKGQGKPDRSHVPPGAHVSRLGETVALPSSGTEVNYYEMTEEACAQYRSTVDPSSDCIEEVTTTVSEEVVGSPGRPLAAAPEAGGGTVLGAAYANVSAAAAAGPVKCKTWTQIRKPNGWPKNINGLFWQFGHSGKFCYDGQYVWYGTYRGNAGYHECGNVSGIGFDVEITVCSASGNKTGQVRFVVEGKVSAISKLLPLSASFKPTVTATKSGTMTMNYDYS